MSDDQLPDDSPFADNIGDKWAPRFRVGVPIAASLMGKWGAIWGPIVGPILGEILAATIPNQRMDRMARYLEKIRQAFPEERLEEIKANDEKIALLEEGMYSASFSTQKSRTDRIASIVIDGLSREAIDLDRSTHLLNLIRTLTDFDVILLHRYNVADTKDWQAIRAFDETHSELFPVRQYSNNRDEIAAAQMRQSLLTSHVNTLVAAGLLEQEGEIRLPAMPRSLSDRNAESTMANYVKAVVTKITERRYKVSSLGHELIKALVVSEPGEATKDKDNMG